MKKKRAILLAVCLIVVLVIYVRRLPMFAGHPGISAEQFTSADVSIIDVESRRPVLEKKLSERGAVQRLVRVLNTARRSSDHKCMEIGYLVLTSDTGIQAKIEFLPGHDPDRYEIRYESKKFDLPREEFVSAIEMLGIPRDKIPLSEHRTSN